MNVLLIRKTTNFELHGARTKRHVETGYLDESNLKKLLFAHDQHYACVDSVRKSLLHHKITWCEITRNEEWPAQIFDCVITIGGDGTLLSASHSVDGKTQIIGIRSSESSVGFLCAYDYKTTEQVVPDLLQNKVKFTPVSRLMATVSRAENAFQFDTVPVLNEFLFANVSPAATTRYKVSFNGRSEFQKSSGIWISTAIGSSAAILAAGGVRLPAEDPRAQYKVRELYNSQGLLLELTGGVFLPDQDQLTIENRNENAMLAIDGQHGEVMLKFGDRIHFKNAKPLQVALRNWGRIF